MKHIFLTLCTLFVCVGISVANVRTVDEAALVAARQLNQAGYVSVRRTPASPNKMQLYKTFYKQTVDLEINDGSRQPLSPTRKNGKRLSPRRASGQNSRTVHIEHSENEPALYVFNGENGGFAVVSADTRTVDLLCYSDTGRLDNQTLNPALQWWLSRFVEEISSLTDEDVIPSFSPNRAPTDVMATAVKPLLGGISYYQRAPYNNFCPTVGGTHCLTGCVATAATQIMRFWKYPSHGVSRKTYTWTYNGSSLNLSADFASATYDYDNMLESYSGSYNTKQANAVATLMYHAGVAASMSYGIDGSSAMDDDMAQGMIDYFGYDCDDWLSMYYGNTVAQILASINADLDAGRPILMGGDDIADGGGHAFVCDGRDANGNIHINWGWAGSGDCYTAITSMHPLNSSYYFKNGLDVTSGLRPATDCVRASNISIAATSDELPVTYAGITMPQAGTYQTPVTVRENSCDTMAVITLTIVQNEASDFGYCGDHLLWSLNSDKTVLTIEGYGDMYDFEYNSNSDNTIPWFSARSTIRTVVMPEGMTSTGNFAFALLSNVSSFSLPSTVEWIGQYTFGICSFSSITLPESLLGIDDYAFYGCTYLTSITIPENVLYLGQYIFQESGLKKVVWNAKECADPSGSYPPFYDVRSQITSFTFGQNVKTIPIMLCFQLTSISTVTIPNQVTYIKTGAFANCTNLTSVRIGSSVETIDRKAFQYTGISSITIPESLTTIADSVFMGCSNLKRVNWNARNCELSANYFYNTPFYPIRSQITSFSIGQNVETLPLGCCLEMTSLSSVTLPASMTNVNGFVFYGCTNLKSMTIPENVTLVGNSAFYNCTGLTSLQCRSANPPLVGDNAFYGVNASIPVTVPCGRVLAYENSTDWNNSFTNFSSYDSEFPFTLTCAVQEDGTGQVEISSQPDCNTNVAEITATPAVGYSFLQWTDGNDENPRTLTVTEDMTLTAEFERNQYTLTFQDEDGTVLESNLWYYGETPIYGGDEPTKDADDEYTYTFAGWANAENVYPLGTNLPDVTGDATYTAVYESETNQYTVTFVDEDGTVLESNLWYYGETPIYNGTNYNGMNPTKDADDEYTYTFAGWANSEDGYYQLGTNLPDVTGDATYTAVYESEQNQYTVTFVDEDGTVLESNLWYYGETPIYRGADPTKDADDEYTYTFAGWTNSEDGYYPLGTNLPVVTGDATYTAVYESELNQYTVSFVDEDGTVLESNWWYYGETPIYRGAEPTKDADDEYTYTFAGWTNSEDGYYPLGTNLPDVTGDATYTAVYESETNQYTVTFVDEDGTVLESNWWYYGETPIYRGAEPTKDADDEYTYTFAGWTNSEDGYYQLGTNLPDVTGDATYTAVYESEQNQYTVTFVDEDGTVLESNWWYYGETPIYRGADPTKDADDEYTYTFAGWTNSEDGYYQLGTNLPDVTGEATYTAVYESEQNQYTVTFVDEDGTVLESNLWYYGETPIYRGAEPTKDADDEYTYTFAGWANAESVYPLGTNLPDVTGDATYTAVYDSEQNQYTVTFVDEDGTVLESNLWYYGETPIYRGAEPSKDADDEYTYTFAGWTNAESVYPLGTNLPVVTGDATYTAVYESELNQYTVTFVDEDGTVLESNLWYYGETPIYRGADPTKDADDEYTYTFAGWTNAESVYPLGTNLPDVTGEATYTASYTATMNLPMNIVLKDEETADYYDQFSGDYDGKTVTTATLKRQFKQGVWSTLCLPFNVNSAMMTALNLRGRVYEFRHAKIEADNGNVMLYFSQAQSMKAGQAYIVNANAALAAKTEFVFAGVKMNFSADQVSDLFAPDAYDGLDSYSDGTGAISLIGTLRKGLLKTEGTQFTYFGLSKNKVYTPNTTSGTSVLAYRGIFRSTEPLNVSTIRIIADGQPVTELQVTEEEPSSLAQPKVRKYTENGILYIERDGIIYNAQGQRVN